MHQIYTIGYERADISDFVETLKLMDVDVLLDIREIPISRRKGFSKTALRSALEEQGIAYHHERVLGSPKTIRHQLRADGDFDRFFTAYDAHLAEQEPVIEELVSHFSGAVALMCFERDHTTCHRRSVANVLAERTGTKPLHIGVQDYAQRQRLNSKGAHSRQSLSAA